jgi:hypothetical protein
MNPKTKQIIIAVIIIVIAFFIFNSFYSVSTVSTDGPLNVDSRNNTQSIDGQAILSLLNRLKDVDLNGKIFSDPLFLNLQSFSRPIAPENLERRNPFAPVGSDNQVNVAKTATSTR